MIQLSPKAIRFIIDAITHYQAYHEERLRGDRLTEEETADLLLRAVCENDSQRGTPREAEHV